MTVRSRLRGRLIEAFVDLAPRARRAAARSTRYLARRPKTLDVWLGVADPYSTLLAQALPKLLALHGERVLRVTLVGAPEADVDPAPELRRAYAPRDAWRLAQTYGLDFPEPTEAAPDPELVRLVEGTLLAETDGRSMMATLAEVGPALWRGDAETLRGVAERRGAWSSGVAERVAQGTRELRAAGHYQPSVMRMDGEWFLGLDRLPRLADRLGIPEGALLPHAEAPDIPLGDVERDADGRPVVDAWLSFRSPYSYLVVDRVLGLGARLPVALRVRPVLPMVMRGLAVPRVKRMALVFDAAREAEALGIPFGRICDPLGAGAERCIAVFGAAEAEGVGPEFLHSAMRGIWSEALDVARDGDLRHVCERVGLDWGVAQRALADGSWRERAEANRQALTDAGLWGVPSFRIGDVSLWGQDRCWMLEDLVERACAG